MKLRVYSDSFQLVLIRASAVRDMFDQHDLSMRQNGARPVLDKYHQNWIHKGVMLVPSFHIIDDKAKVGTGRHRLTMLSRHLTEIPAAFESSFSKSERLDQVYDSIVLRSMSEFEEYEYPNLPIEHLGDDINGGLDWKAHI